MLTEIKHYTCYNQPEEQDLIDAMRFAKEWNCIVRIHWTDKLYGALSINVTKNDSLTDCKRRVWKKYI